MSVEIPEGVAIIGMAGRFPGAENVDEFWRNLVAGAECISTFSETDLVRAGLEAEKARLEGDCVAAHGVLKQPEYFDAAFFGMNPREAEVTDPQQRVFLETAWEALENAGYDPGRFPGAIGVYAGMGNNSYLLRNLIQRRDLIDSVGWLVAMTGNEKDYLATRVAYKLNLRGPAISVHTACSSSLVAVGQACQSLLGFQCDMALAGGVSITFPHPNGYRYQEGGMLSPDGHCRAFDAEARGTVPGDGAGIVVLKRLAEAVQDGDEIHAVIKGVGINNDGSARVSFTAPSVDGQTEAVALALAVAGFDPSTLSYIETHGTGTPLGDPIEIAALKQAFGRMDKKNFCAIGSVKSNIGHLDTAAGVAGLIKAALSLKNKKLPPSLHFKQPNPQINFADSPFRVNADLAAWERGSVPRRAGVSSFGFGGTNAHVALEEAPEFEQSGISRAWQLVVLSARTESALEKATTNLAAHFKREPKTQLADAAFTLQTGRAEFGCRRIAVCRDTADAAGALETRDAKRVFTRQREVANPPVVFMFPGQGVQYVNMGAGLYRSEPVFREEMDRCAKLLHAHLGRDLREILYPADVRRAQAESELVRTCFTQPALFVVEYALARLWMSWGVKPAAMIGHSVGEYVAACLAGVFSLAEALRLVAERARLVQLQPAGAMLAVRLQESELMPLLPASLNLAAVNAPSVCVVAGSLAAIEDFERVLEQRGVAGRRLPTSHAFHSAMMDPVLGPFRELLRNLEFRKPEIPYVSNVTGRWVTEAQAVDPDYWAGHVRQTVRFADGVGELLRDPQRILLEVGPGRTLGLMAKQHPDATGGRVILPSILATDESSLEVKSMLESLGKLWLAGCTVDWTGFYRHERRRRVALPTYPFERRRFWVEPHKREQPAMPHERVAGPVRAAIEEQLEGVKTAGKSRPFQNEFAEAGPVLARVMAQLENLSGRPRAELSSSATFMEMGFDSLFLAQMSQAIQGKFGIKVTFRQMTEELPTPEALARYIEGGEKGQRTGAISEGRPATGKGNGAATHPLSDGQMEVWLAVQMGEDANRAFNQVFTVRLRGGLNLERLRESVREFARRHDAFRITFAADGSGQTIHPEIRLEVPVIELSSERNADLGLSKVVEEEQRERFDLVSGPLVRAKIVRVSSGDHVLVLAAHHLVLDGWSAGVMLHELSLAYSGGNGLIVPMQYADFLLEQRNAATRAKLAKTEEWWLREFADPPPSVELPADRPRPAKKTFRATQETIVLDESFYRDLKRAAGRQGCTLFTYLFGSFVVWLHRLGGQGEIVVGVPAAGQMNGDGEGQARRALVGHCVNLLPLRCRCEAGVTFEEHLKHVKRVVLDAHEHQPFTFGSLVRALNLPRDSSRLPLVSTTFNLNRLIPRCDWEGTEAEIATPPRSFNIFDLSVDIRDSGTDLKIDCCFNADLFDRDTMARWLGHWRTLLKATLTRPQENVVRLPLLEEDERNRLLVEWNDTLVELPKEAACVHELVEAQVKRTPEAVALEFQDCRLTYGELNARSEQLAENLRRQGIGPGALVGLRMERSLEMVAGMLGILKTGGAYVPLDPNHPKERVEFILKDSEVKVVIGEEQVPRTIQNPGLRIQGSSHHQAAMEAAAYVLYTSGSTGRPKGVVIPHRSLVNFLWSMSQEPGLNSSDVLLAVTTLSFDIAGLEIWLPLICGAKVVIASRETAMDGKRLARKLTESGATVMQATPATWRMLLDAGWAGDSKLKILCGGEAWSEELVRQLLPKCGSLWNMYGPTETTIWSAATRIEKPETPLIGRPIANTQFYVLDREMQPLPVGVPGELHIGGLGLALGYLNRPELTAEKFVPDPFSSRPGARLYKTGDLVRHRDDGRIEFLGRLDHQVKIRGHRIELGEVEAALRDHAGIRDVVVIARGTAGESQLVAYLVARDGAQLEPGELRAFLKERLPEHMMPSAFVVLDALPLSPNGKVDRKNLPPPGVEAAAGASALPQTEMEKSLAEIWCELLGLKRVGIHDDFFELGGHSLAATRLIARLEDFTGEDLSLRDIFDSPTIAKLSARLGG